MSELSKATKAGQLKEDFLACIDRNFKWFSSYSFAYKEIK
jgi:hypothetical protein